MTHNSGNVAWNFYSTGDEVVENAFVNEKVVELDDFIDGSFNGRHAWVKQEIGKGGKFPLFDDLFHDVNGGWKFNDGENGYRKLKTLGGYRRLEPEEAAAINSEDLKTKPFYAPLYFPEIYDPLLGPRVAEDSDDRELLLATGIPATSFAIAVNEIPKFRIENGGEKRNYNMQAEFKSEEAKTVWPVKFPDYASDWLHSDFKDVSLQFIHPFYQRIIDIAELDKD